MPEQDNLRGGAALREAVLGAVLGLLGVGVASEASRYPLGSAHDMGPGYFPLVLGVLLAGIGAILVLRSLPKVDALQARTIPAALLRSHLWPVALALLGFGLVVEQAGLFLSTVGLVLAASAAGPGFLWRSALLWGVAVAVFCSLLFVGLLGLQLPVWPRLPA